MDLVHRPALGGPAQENSLVVKLLSEKLRGLTSFQGENYLDIGCGNGAFTLLLGEGFIRTFGIDVEPLRLQTFLQKARFGESHLLVAQMSAEELGFPAEHFDVITAIEVIEHIADLSKALSEVKRVLKPGGVVCITCPNRLFPFETHGIRWREKEIVGRFPLLPYIPWLHSRLALARVFTLHELDGLLTPLGFRRCGVDFAFPTLERGSRLGRAMRPFRGFLRFLERTPLKILGVSTVACYEKSLEPASRREA
jgi:SAM-dependent methyltransferase